MLITSHIVANGVTSDPVPEVVGIAHIGIGDFIKYLLGSLIIWNNSFESNSLDKAAEIALAESIHDPPPNAIIASILFEEILSISFCISYKEGFDLIESIHSTFFRIGYNTESFSIKLLPQML